jgi:hypothetical protein
MAKTKRKAIPNADLLTAVRSHKNQILALYARVQDKRPVLLFDCQHQKLHAYSREKYRAKLQRDSQPLFDKEYETAKAKNKILVLVWDNATRRLVTTTLRRA